MIFITHLLAEEPEKLAGPLLADTYVTLLKGRNAWYGQMLAKGELNLDMGDSISGKGMIQVMIQIYFFLQNRFKMHQILQLLTMLGRSSMLGQLWEQPEAGLTGFWRLMKVSSYKK